MELISYIRLFRKWFWLLLLGAFLAGGAAFVFRSEQPDTYRARVTISVGGFIEAPNPDYAEIRTGAELAQTYAVVAQTYDVLEATVESGEFPISPEELGGYLSTEVIPNTSLLVLTITYTDPVLAADLANEVANQIIENSPSNLTPEQHNQIELANAEIARLNEELQQARLRRDEIDQQLTAAIDPAEIEQLRQQRNVVADQINQASANIAMFSSTISTLQQRTNSLDIVERARVSMTPTGPNVWSQVALGAVVGIALAAGIALLIEYLDDTIRSPEEATQFLALPTLAVISRFGRPRDSYPQRLITYHDPGSPISEEYRTLRTNLLYSANGTEGGSTAYIVTSPNPSEGKSVTAANLAVSMAMAGLRVLLIDADLRRPRLHDIFGLDNNIGLSTLLSAEPGGVWSGEEDGIKLPIDPKKCLQQTEIPGLRVITSGYIPLNPTEVLGSVGMQRWFEQFRSARNVDIVLFDTPPLLVMADSSVLAAATKAPVLLVLEAGQTRRNIALRAKHQLEQLNIEIAGIVLNSVNPKEQGYGYGYYYYYSDSGTESRS